MHIQIGLQKSIACDRIIILLNDIFDLGIELIDIDILLQLNV